MRSCSARSDAPGSMPRSSASVGFQPAGGEFDSGFTGPEGPYIAHMRIAKVDGDYIRFDVKTQRS